MRILLTPTGRKDLFDFLKAKYDCKTFKHLSEKIHIHRRTLEKYRSGLFYIPETLIPQDFTKLEIQDKKPDNWGRTKGGQQGIEKKIKILKKLWGNADYHKSRSEIGKKAIQRIRTLYSQEELVRMAVIERKKKRNEKSKLLESENTKFFTDERILLNTSNIQRGRSSSDREIIFPKEMSAELAEEIGIHLGDGCLSYNRKYYSVKTNKKEEDYMTNFIFPLYKKLYNLDLKLMKLESVVGFEIYSSAFFQFKHEVLHIPYGNKVERIKVPACIIDCRNKEIYKAFIRGLFDTDGCVNIVTSKNNYPTITFTIKSQELIKEVREMLLKLGYIPYVGKYRIDLNGQAMVMKWVKEINSNNPKNLTKLQQAISSARIE